MIKEKNEIFDVNFSLHIYMCFVNFLYINNKKDQI